MTDRQSPRPSSREVAALVAAYRAMVADADGWASQIPADRRDAWIARKDALLARIHTATSHDQAKRDVNRTGFPGGS